MARTTRRTLLAGALLCFALTAPALAKSGRGEVIDASFDDKTVTIGSAELRVGPTSRFATNLGEELSFFQFESYWIGEIATYTATAGIIDQVIVDDPDSDEVDID